MNERFLGKIKKGLRGVSERSGVEALVYDVAPDWKPAKTAEEVLQEIERRLIRAEVSPERNAVENLVYEI